MVLKSHHFFYHSLFSKKKHYDGSETLKMIGNDCKILENNIDTFLDVFVKERGDDWNSSKSLKLRQVLKLYQLFKDLAVYVDIYFNLFCAIFQV